MLVIISCTFFKDNFDIFCLCFSIITYVSDVYFRFCFFNGAHARYIGIGAGREIMEKQFSYRLAVFMDKTCV